VIEMHSRVFSLCLVLSSLLATSAVKIQGQEKTEDALKTERVDPKTTGPMVETWEPKTGSTNSYIVLSGYRLYPGDLDKAKAFFLQNAVEIPARVMGGWSTINNDHNGPQKLKIIVPEEVVQGQAQIVVDVNGRRSIPATVTITEWQPPVIKRINPTRVAPGSFVEIECDGFHFNDELEITDGEGNPFRYHGGGSSNGTGFGIPEDASEGVITFRIGNKKYGNGQYTEPFTFTITNEPLPVEVITSWMKSVAPGQWLGLQVSNREPFKHSELTEVAFKQAGRTIVVAPPKPFRSHVEVPSALSPGDVELQVRTWRDGRPSEWSAAVVFKIADKPRAPSIGAIRTATGDWVQLWPGPDREKSFTVSPGDEVVLNGLWPVADASKLRVSLIRPGEVITMTATEQNEKADWFSDVLVRLPESLEIGEWRMIVTSETDGTQDEVPIVINVVSVP
jgi:hypothetical protein